MRNEHADATPTPGVTPALEQLRLAAVRWALAHGHPLNPRTLSTVLAAQAAVARRERRHLHYWSTDTVLGFLFGDLGTWCAEHGVRAPLNPGETLVTYLAFLDDHARLARGSSLYPELQATIAELCGLDDDGRRPAGHVDAVVRPLVSRNVRAARAAHPARRTGRPGT